MTRRIVRLVLAVILVVVGLVLMGAGMSSLAGTAGLLIEAGLVLIILGAVIRW